MKLDRYGNKIWEEKIRVKGRETVDAVELSKDGSIIVVGRTNPFKLDKTDIFVLKVLVQNFPHISTY